MSIHDLQHKRLRCDSSICCVVVVAYVVMVALNIGRYNRPKKRIRSVLFLKLTFYYSFQLYSSNSSKKIHLIKRIYYPLPRSCTEYLTYYKPLALTSITKASTINCIIWTYPTMNGIQIYIYLIAIFLCFCIFIIYYILYKMNSEPTHVNYLLPIPHLLNLF